MKQIIRNSRHQIHSTASFDLHIRTSENQANTSLLVEIIIRDLVLQRPTDWTSIKCRTQVKNNGSIIHLINQQFHGRFESTELFIRNLLLNCNVLTNIMNEF